MGKKEIKTEIVEKTVLPEDVVSTLIEAYKYSGTRGFFMQKPVHDVMKRITLNNETEFDNTEKGLVMFYEVLKKEKYNNKILNDFFNTGA